MITPCHPAFRRLPSPHPRCRIAIVIPVRNEQQRLTQCLQSLCNQRTLSGQLLRREEFEVLLLLNNCTDGSVRVAQQFAAAHPDLRLHIAEHSFSSPHAHVGSARSLLMQQAALRLRSVADGGAHASHQQLLLTTDADTTVEAHWLAQTAAAIRNGADAVGGDIRMSGAERLSLSRHARLAYALDRRYLRSVALLESLLDPLHHDPWPRHQHHFGASLACTLHAFEACGGMQPAPALEDLAFYHALLAAGMRFRHEPRVRVFTSARTQGRASIGLSEQLRKWHGTALHRVPSCRFHERRCLAMAALRAALRGRAGWHRASRLLRIAPLDLKTAALTLGSAEATWAALLCDTRINAGLSPAERCGDIRAELRTLQQLIRSLQQTAAAHPVDTTVASATAQLATTAA